MYDDEDSVDGIESSSFRKLNVNRFENVRYNVDNIVLNLINNDLFCIAFYLLILKDLQLSHLKLMLKSLCKH